MWLYSLLVILLVAAALYPFQGWIAYVVQQRKRERKFTVSTPRHRPIPGQWPADRLTIT